MSEPYRYNIEYEHNGIVYTGYYTQHKGYIRVVSDFGVDEPWTDQNYGNESLAEICFSQLIRKHAIENND